MPLYHNHSGKEVTLMIPNQRQGRVSPPRINKKTGKPFVETRVITVPPHGSEEIPLTADVVAKKAPQLKPHRPKNPKAYDEAAAAAATKSLRGKFMALRKEDHYSLFDILQLDLEAQVKALREYLESDREGDPVKEEMAELLARYEEQYGSKSMDDAMATLAHSGGTGKMPDTDTGE